MLNRVELQGRIGADLVVRSPPAGKPVISFPLAVDRDFRDKDGTRPTDWFTVVAWSGLAEHIGECFSKGDMIILSGRLQSRVWTNSEGQNIKFVEVIAENAYFAGGQRSGGQLGEEAFVKPEEEFVKEDEWDGL